MFMCIECSLSNDPTQYAQFGNYIVNGTALCYTHAMEAKNETNKIRPGGPEIFCGDSSQDATSTVDSTPVDRETKTRSDSLPRRKSSRAGN